MSDITIVKDEYSWENKYRPSNIEEIVLPSDVRAQIQGYVKSEGGKIPSLLFYSPDPGTGKTTTALALCKAINCVRPLFINASLDNSIDVIRERVLQYSTGVSVFGGRKVVILDEVERLSPAAQESLKGIVEAVSKNCSFILTTNAKQRVNEPLRSRCREVDFIWNKKEADEVQLQFMRRCADILKLEGISYDPRVLAVVVKKNFPDNRRIMGILQDNATTHGTLDERALAVMKTADMQTLVDALKAKDWGNVKQWVTDNQNYITEDFYSRFFVFCVPNVADKPRQVVDNSIPDLVCVCGQSQIEHRQVGDVWLHALYFLTNVMMTINWK